MLRKNALKIEMGILSTLGRFLPFGCFCCFTPSHDRHVEMPKIEEVTLNEKKEGEIVVYELNDDSDEKTMRVVCISDTHGKHRKLNLPEGDVLIHAGDFSPYYGLSNSETLKDFDDWLGTQTQFKHKIVICGNHDLVAERWFYGNKVKGPLLKNAVLLLGTETEPYEIYSTAAASGGGGSLKIFGTPWYVTH